MLTSAIDNSLLSGETIEIYVDDKHIGSTQTTTSGSYTFTYATEKLHEGVYTLYARFTPHTKVWRSSSSEIIALQVNLGLFQYLTAVAIIVVITSTLLLVFFFRKTIGNLLTKKKPTRQLVPPPSTASILHPPEKIHFDKKKVMVATPPLQRGNLKDAIISRYQILIRFLTTSGMTISPSYTHLDIRNAMIKDGLPRKATDAVTQTFELALYSPYPLSKDDVTLFNKNIRVILKNLGG
jgi:hypothetical protein